MTAERPHIDVSADGGDHLLTAIALAGVATAILIVAIAYPALPAQVPRHLDALGQPTAYGPRWSILILPAMNTVMTGMLLALLRLPPYSPWINYPFPITEANAKSVYRQTWRMVRALAAVIAWVFTAITAEFVSIAFGRSMIGGWLLAVIFIPPLLVIGIFLPLIARAARTGARNIDS